MSSAFQAERDRRGAAGHLARQEPLGPARRLVVERDRARRVQPGPAVGADEPMGGELRHPVRRPRAHRRRLALRRLACIPEHLAGGRHDHAHPGALGRREQRRRRARDLGERRGRVRPGRRDERRRREVEQLVGRDVGDEAPEPGRVGEVAAHERHVVRHRGEVGRVGARVAHHPHDLAAGGDEQLCEVGAVLSGDPGDERAARGPCWHARQSTKGVDADLLDSNPAHRPPATRAGVVLHHNPRMNPRDFGGVSPLAPCDDHPHRHHVALLRGAQRAVPARTGPAGGDRRARRPGLRRRLRRRPGLDGRRRSPPAAAATSASPRPTP